LKKSMLWHTVVHPNAKSICTLPKTKTALESGTLKLTIWTIELISNISNN
jgi:hypothetical protein